MGYRKRFFAAYLVLAAVAGGLVAVTVALAVLPGTSSASERRPSPVHPASRAVPSASRHTTGPALAGFAASFQAYASTAQAGFGGPNLIVRDCVEGGDGTAFCAYTVPGRLPRSDAHRAAHHGQTSWERWPVGTRLHRAARIEVDRCKRLTRGKQSSRSRATAHLEHDLATLSAAGTRSNAARAAVMREDRVDLRA